jgi:hypothetical protein
MVSSAVRPGAGSHLRLRRHRPSRRPFRVAEPERAARPRAGRPPGGCGQAAGPRRISGLRPQQPATLARRRFRPSFSVPFCRLTGSAAARRHRDHRARPRARQHPPSRAPGRDLRRDHPIPATRAHRPRAACPDNPHAARPAGIHQRDHEGDQDQHIRAGRHATAGMRGSHKCQRTRLTAPPKAKQPPAHTAALPHMRTTGRLATGPATRFTAGAATPGPHGRAVRTPPNPAIAEPDNPVPQACDALPHPIRLTGRLADSESWKETLTSYAAGGHSGGRSADVVTGCTSEKPP